MPGLQLLLRAVPLLVGALAAAIWLQRRRAQRGALAGAPAAAQIEPSHGPIDIVTIVDDVPAVDP
jgi:hypothetical protein